ncbi:MAG: hypothetical protein OEY34_09780, partial [Cyclobacteriaceae bacterium]|nr:hypothetical protein [Cyclobacteriaceae bacterium]
MEASNVRRRVRVRANFLTLFYPPRKILFKNSRPDYFQKPPCFKTSGAYGPKFEHFALTPSKYKYNKSS